MHIASKAYELTGHTPLLRVHTIERELGLTGRLLVKLEYLNPTGSVKDRAARFIIEDAERSGALRAGGTIIEATSGNTGIGLAAIAAAKGYRLILTMPETMSEERRRLLNAYGAEIVLTPGAEGMAEAAAKAEELARTTPNSIIAGQFENEANVRAHMETTGPELWEDTDGSIDVFVAGVGTGGTITGTGRFLKQHNPAITVIAVEPERSPLLSKGTAGPHGIQGIGSNFIPKILDRRVYDAIAAVSDDDAIAAAKLLARKEGVLTGISSGAALHAAIKAAQQPAFSGKTIVALLPDSADRYYSTALFR